MFLIFRNVVYKLIILSRDKFFAILSFYFCYIFALPVAFEFFFLSISIYMYIYRKNKSRMGSSDGDGCIAMDRVYEKWSAIVSRQSVVVGSISLNETYGSATCKDENCGGERHSR